MAFSSSSQVWSCQAARGQVAGHGRRWAGRGLVLQLEPELAPAVSGGHALELFQGLLSCISSVPKVIGSSCIGLKLAEQR